MSKEYQVQRSKTNLKIIDSQGVIVGRMSENRTLLVATNALSEGHRENVVEQPKTADSQRIIV